MMTAAGTIAPARVLVMGVGVAGLQAIATAKRLGAIVSATDVRPATKEQVESLGGTFVAVMDEEFKNAQTAGGYAKEMSKEYQAKQAALIAETIKKQDIIITTALIPGRKAPLLVSEEMIRTMKPGSVIVDLAAEAGGNTPLTKANEVIEDHAWRHHHGLHQFAGTAGGGFLCAVCAQSVQFHRADRGQENRPACDRLD
jgi:NAD(P) transhydrogenase subunit alpha